MTNKTQQKVRIRWVRSGIGFPYRVKVMIRSLGLGRLNQVVERPDTPQIRGLVARMPHLVEVVSETAAAVKLLGPEYTIIPVAKPIESPKPVQREPVEADGAAIPAGKVEGLVSRPEPKHVHKPAVHDTSKVEKLAERAAGKSKTAKPAEKKKTEKAAAKTSKSTKKGKK
jgi:large subunit ribosomal protein L30